MEPSLIFFIITTIIFAIVAGVYINKDRTKESCPVCSCDVGKPLCDKLAQLKKNGVENMEYKGNDLFSFNSDIAQCMITCGAMEQCKAYSYDGTEKKCTLKSSMNGLTVSNGWISSKID